MRRGVFAVFIAVTIASSGCGAWHELFSSSRAAVAPAGGDTSCSRASRDDLLAALNRTCSLSSECPSGAFCDVSVGGFCNFQCYDSSECPGTEVCNCFGQCVGSAPADGGTTPDPACPRDPALVTSAATAARSCQYDDECPYGTFCNVQTGKCDHLCLNDSECTGTADGGTSVCDCFGRCTISGAPAATPPAQLPRLSVTPTAIELPAPQDGIIPVKPSFAPQNILVKVHVPGSDPLLGPAIKVHALAGKYLEISCPPASCRPDPATNKTCPAAGYGSYAPSCDLESWSWAPDRDGLVAQFTVQARPSSAVPPAGELSQRSWSVSFRSLDITNAIAATTITYGSFAPSTLGSFGPVPQVTGGYAGSAQVTMPDGKIVMIDLQALAQPDARTLALYDKMHLLSPSGIISIDIGGSSRYETWLTTTVGAASDPQPVTQGAGGFLWALVTGTGMQVSSRDQSLTGHVQIQAILNGTVQPNTGFYVPGHETEIDVHYNLYPAPVPTCAGPSPTLTCSATAGYTCVSGFCSDRFEERAVGGLGLTSLTTSYFSDWYIGIATNPVPIQSLGPFSINCHFPDAGSGLYGPTVLPTSGDFACNGVNIQTFLPPPMGVNLIGHNDMVEWASRRPPGAFPDYYPRAVMNGADLFSACVDELARKPPRRESLLVSGDFVNDNIGQGNYFDPSARCVALGYFLTTLWTVRPLHNNGGTLYQRFYERLLQQWLEMHAFVARQGLQSNALDQILAVEAGAIGGTTGPTPPPGPSKVQLLDILARGWSLVLSQTTNIEGNAFDVVPVDQLVNPDYRLDENVAIPNQPEHEQPSGLPTTMLETMAAHLDVVTTYLGEVDAQTIDESRGSFSPARDQGLRRAGDALRLATAVYGTAAAAHDRACTAAGACFLLSWEPRWQQGIGQLAGARDRVIATADRMARGHNPLGVDDNDVPLFFGDPTGATSRYFASSDYLLNTWAAPAVVSAQSALATARQAWLDRRNSNVQDHQLEIEKQQKLEQLGEEYGGVIIENCGLTSVDGQSVEGKDIFQLVGDHKISLQNCFMEHSAQCVQPPPLPSPHPAANAVAESNLAHLTREMAAHQLCTWGHLQARLDLPADVQACLNQHSDTWDDIQLVFISDTADQVECQNTLFDARVLWRDVGTSTIDPAEMAAAEAACDQLIAPAYLPAAHLPASCLHGRMGDAYSRITAATDEVNVALANMQQTQVALNEKWDQCLQLNADNQTRLQAQDVVQKMRDNWAHMADVAKTSNDITNGITKFVEGGVEAVAEDYVGAAMSFVSGISSFFGGGADEAAQHAKDQLQIAEDEYKDLVDNQMHDEAIRACFGDAHVLKASIDTARETILARQSALTTAVIDLANMLDQNVQKYNEGSAVLAREQNRSYGGYSHHFWLDEKITRFGKEMEWARRLTYLAMRAVEYEFQQSTPLRGQILNARHPDQLEDAVRYLQQEQAGRTINRRRPEELSLVMSVRDDILRVGDRTGAGPGERAWSPARRFQGRLSHPEFAIRDTSGNWLGQGIRFPLDPSAGGAQNGVALANRCGERLWRITATIQGDALSENQPGTPILLLKENTFQSQWCQGLDDGTTFQTSSIQPSRQLFRPTDVAAPVDESRGFTAASIYPWFNIRRSDFYKLTYQDGSSEELAGRGLYGDYILLFPKELIETGFPLDNVEDILIRLDYLSIDNLPLVSE